MEGSAGLGRWVRWAGVLTIGAAVCWELAFSWPRTEDGSSGVGWLISSGASYHAAVLLLPAFLGAAGLAIVVGGRTEVLAFTMPTLTVPVTWVALDSWQVDAFADLLTVGSAGLALAAFVAGATVMVRQRRPVRLPNETAPALARRVVLLLSAGAALGAADWAVPFNGTRWGDLLLPVFVPFVMVSLMAAVSSHDVARAVVAGQVAACAGSLVFSALFFSVGYSSRAALGALAAGVLLALAWWLVARRAPAGASASDPGDVGAAPLSRLAKLAAAATALVMLAGTGSLVAVDVVKSNRTTTTGVDARPNAVRRDELSGTPERGGTAVVGLPHAPASLDPTGGEWDRSDLIEARALYDPLMALDAELRPKPYLALALDHDDELTRWTIRLRPDVTFHDGSPVDASAVAANLEAQRQSSAGRPLLAGVDRVEAVGADAVVVTLARPWPAFPEVLAGQPGMIAAPTTLMAPSPTTATAGTSATAPATTGPLPAPTPVGSGPFRVAPGPSERAFTLERNPSYWRSGLPYLDRVQFVVEPDPAVRWDHVERGDVDGAMFPEPDHIARLTAPTENLDAYLVSDDAGAGPPVIGLPPDGGSTTVDGPVHGGSAAPIVWSQRVHGAFAYPLPDGTRGAPSGSTFLANVWRSR